jgi:AraC-like DNA-binding protein
MSSCCRRISRPYLKTEWYTGAVKKIHSFFALITGSLLLLLALVVFYNGQSSRIDALTLESMTILAEWNKLKNKTSNLLLNRYTQFGTEMSPVISSWGDHYLAFNDQLTQLMENPFIRRQPAILTRLEGAYRVWRYSEVRLNNARQLLTEIIRSGLGEKVMVNGLIHTMYQLRMESRLTVDEIIQLEETIYALESLSTTAAEFDNLFTSIVEEMETEGERYLRRIRILFAVLFGTVLLAFTITLLINRQLKTAQENRRTFLLNERRRLLRRLFDESTEETLKDFRTRRDELGIRISIDLPLFLIILQIDSFFAFTRSRSLDEQQVLLQNLSRDLLEQLNRHAAVSEWFPVTDETFAIPVNTLAEDPQAQLETLMIALPAWQGTACQRHGCSFSLTISDFCFETDDLDHDFSLALKLSGYRYLLGHRAFITPGCFQTQPSSAYRYPLDKERQFIEAFKSLDREATAAHMHEIVNLAAAYGPEAVQRTVLRLTAAESSVVELLEKSFGISEIAGVTPMILEIQKLETLNEALDMLSDVVGRVIASCHEKKNRKHDETIVLIKDIVERELENFDLSADSIASRLKLSSSYTNRFFKQQTGMSIAGYINEIRLERAEELLSTGGMTVAEVAARAGFASTGTFFRLFKKKFGQTPGERLSGHRSAGACPDPEIPPSTL